MIFSFRKKKKNFKKTNKRNNNKSFKPERAVWFETEQKSYFFGALALYYYRIHICCSLFIFFSPIRSLVLRHLFHTIFNCCAVFFGCFSLFFFIDSLKPIKNICFIFYFSLFSVLLFSWCHIRTISFVWTHTHSMCFIRLGFVGFFLFMLSQLSFMVRPMHTYLCSIVIQNERILFAGP